MSKLRPCQKRKAFPEIPFNTRECPNAAIARNVFLTPLSKGRFKSLRRIKAHQNRLNDTLPLQS
ncbi:hypothetical protein P7K49_039875 [Saguinus oedipus]|uniref:Uncharacterized protein n=1 Tax=Saguinus oedipus TaxID=9490 RepID=A0ABQ9T9L2_SAGOE|nr:hypothetical protein P7K49_039875 [Saguinus oedipus]